MNEKREMTKSIVAEGPDQTSDAYDGKCPSCGHIFLLADLRRMAVGDGWQRWIRVHLSNGREALVSFDDFDPQTMTALPEVRPPDGD